MAKKNAKVINPTALQKLIGWSGGKPSITKIEPPLKKQPGEILSVDDGVITSSAAEPKQYYWVWKTETYVKKDDVSL